MSPASLSAAGDAFTSPHLLRIVASKNHPSKKREVLCVEPLSWCNLNINEVTFSPESIKQYYFKDFTNYLLYCAKQHLLLLLLLLKVKKKKSYHLLWMMMTKCVLLLHFNLIKVVFRIETERYFESPKFVTNKKSTTAYIYSKMFVWWSLT